MSGVEAALREPWTQLEEQSAASRFGMWVFLVSEILFFAAFFMAFTYLRIMHIDAFRQASVETGLAYGTTNTILLLTSSFTMGLVTRAAELDLRRIAVAMLAVTAALGCGFLVVKGFEYADDIAKDLVPGPRFPIPRPAAELFFSAYWIITIVHVIHLSIGILAVGRLAFAVERQALPLASPQVQVTALYWSFVDIVWVLLYPIIYLGGQT